MKFNIELLGKRHRPYLIISKDGAGFNKDHKALEKLRSELKSLGFQFGMLRVNNRMVDVRVPLRMKPVRQ